jgi:hypothetical protein
MAKGQARPTREKRKPKASPKKKSAGLTPSRPEAPSQAEPSEMYKLFTRDRSFD